MNYQKDINPIRQEKESVTNIQVPFGSTGGSVVFVEKINKEEPVTPTETVATITFATADGEVVGTTTVSTTAVGGEGEAWTFMLGEDYELPEGYKLAEGVEQTTNVIIPFGAIGGHTLIVEKINKEENQSIQLILKNQALMILKKKKLKLKKIKNLLKLEIILKLLVMQ